MPLKGEGKLLLIIFIILITAIIFREEIKTLIALWVVLAIIWYGFKWIFDLVVDNKETISKFYHYSTISFCLIALIFAIFKSQAKKRRESSGLLPDSGADEPATTVSTEPRKDYSEYERKGFIVRDYRAGRDRSAKREEDR